MNSTKNSFAEKFIVMDIEGTTTSIKFVKDVLFPYAREHLQKYIDENWENEELKSVIKLVKQQYLDDRINKIDGLVPIEEDHKEKDSIIKNLLWQMDLDRKTNGLKKLQGYIWRKGYYSGEIKGHVYKDVGPALKQWKERGKRLYIYSSGSIEAQKLLFGYSEKGNMLDLFSGYFDTEVGTKVESSSYRKIASTIGCCTRDILYLTDALKEAEAAAEAGCKVVILERPGNAPIPELLRNTYTFVQSFDQLIIKV